MTENITKLLFALLRSVVNGDKLSEQEKSLYTDEMLPKLIEISKKHDVAHLTAQGLVSNSLLKNNNGANNEILKAVYRYEQINYEYENLCKALETAEIPFMPLKGSILRSYYPEPWMRTSCDIDVLVHPKDTEKAVEYLVDNLGYVESGKCSHDVSLFTQSEMHIELHYDLLEGGIANKSSEVLEKVWDTATLRNGYSYFYEMPDEMFYFYHIAHMAKHFENGGCGIRPFIDLWILDNIPNSEKCKRDLLLEQGELLKFSSAMRELGKVWFGNAEHSALTKQTESYILGGGVYGTAENRIAVQQQQRGGKLKYALSKIFIPYDNIKFHYPILQKHRWLTPVMEVRRWFKLVFCGHAKRSVRELKQNNNISNTEAENIRVFLNNIGL